jgi:hypothetical protein
MKAFPTSADNGHSKNQDGMDLRDYFAAKIAATLITNESIIENADEQDFPFPIYIAVLSYDVADAMMKVRKSKMKG